MSKEAWTIRTIAKAEELAARLAEIGHIEAAEEIRADPSRARETILFRVVPSSGVKGGGQNGSGK